MTNKNYAVIGLGSMGFGIASSILNAGHTTCGYDLNEEAVARFKAQGGGDGQLGDVAPDLDGAVVVVLNAAQTEAVLFGEAGIVPQMKSGSVVVACATVPPEFARDMASRCAERGVHYLDAPMSGGSVKAMQGQLSFMASGTKEAFAAARPILDAAAETVFELGDAAGALREESFILS